MGNVFLGKVKHIDLIAKIITTDKDARAIMPDNVQLGDYVGMNKDRNTYIMDKDEAKLYLDQKPSFEKSEYRMHLEERARQLGIQFQANMKDETLEKKIKEAESSMQSGSMHTGLTPSSDQTPDQTPDQTNG